jgi:DNA-binding Lrp family transcriptional regulator
MVRGACLPPRIMPRTKISRDLGPLPRRGPRMANQKATNLLRIIRSLALKNQRNQSRVFYSVREVAKQFRVPLSTVAKIYRDMEQDGLLSRVRGSRTILNGLRHHRRLSVRAFVGLPAVLSNFITIQDYRTFFTCIRHELWLRGFATMTVFFRPDEVADGTLSERLKSFEVDTVIWLSPGRSARESLLRLSEMGLRVVGISQVGTPTMPSRYYVWKESAVENLLRNWKDRNSVRRITVIDSKDYRSPVIEEILRLALTNLGIESINRSFRNEPTHAFLHDLHSIKTDGIIFASSALASMFAFRNPDEIVDLLRAHRVAFIDGPIDMPFAEVSNAPADLVTVDWPSVAKSIVDDLITLEAFDRNRHTLFEAQAHFRVPLSSFSETIRPLRT